MIEMHSTGVLILKSRDDSTLVIIQLNLLNV